MGCVQVRPASLFPQQAGSFASKNAHLYPFKKSKEGKVTTMEQTETDGRNKNTLSTDTMKISAHLENDEASHDSKKSKDGRNKNTITDTMKMSADVENDKASHDQSKKCKEKEGATGTLTAPNKVPKSSSSRKIVLDKGPDKYMLRSHTARISNLPKHLEGEQIAAGWPPWLTNIAGEALVGWIPRRADSFEKLSKIGQGTYSNVYKARDLDSKEIVALKKVKFDNLEPESVKFMLREIKVLRQLDHPNIVKLKGLVTSRMSCSLYLVFEYMDHDLAGLASCPEISFTEEQIKCYLKQLFLGLDHCHKSHVLHRDIKGSNLLIDGEGTLKIADFGLATFFDPHHNQAMTSRVVTLWYRAPELLLGATTYGAAIDLWSAGCILAELFARKPIMPARTEVEQLHKIFKLCGSPTEEYWKKSNLPHATMFKSQQPYKRALSETFQSFPISALKLLETLLAIDPSERGTASEALQSEFFKTPPFACDPLSLPKYPPNKELDARQRLEEARRIVENEANMAKLQFSNQLFGQEISSKSQIQRPLPVRPSSHILMKSKSSNNTSCETTNTTQPTSPKYSLAPYNIIQQPKFFASSPTIILPRILEEGGVAPKSGPIPIDNTNKLLAMWKQREVVQELLKEENIQNAPPRAFSKDLRSLSISYLRAPGSKQSYI